MSFLSSLLCGFAPCSQTVPVQPANTSTDPSVSDTARFFAGLQSLVNDLPGATATVDFGRQNICISLNWNGTDGAAMQATDTTDETVIDDRHFVRVTCTKDEEVQAYRMEPENLTSASVTVTSTDVTVTVTDVNLNSTNAKQEVKKTDSKPVKTPSKQHTLMSDLCCFFRKHYDFRFNQLTGQTEFARVCPEPLYHSRFEEPLSPPAVYRPVTDRALNAICIDAFNHDVECWDRDVKRYIQSDIVKEYHPFTTYFDALPAWDGRDRVTPLARRVNDSEWWTESFHTWLLAATAQWMNFGRKARANAVSPLLISTRQGMGKSTFCKLLLPEELQCYYTDSYDLNAASGCEQKLAAFGLVNLDEFDKLSPNRMPQLKNLMQMNSLSVRKAYRRTSESLPRIASFIGTSNRTDLLTDATGSRRFICIEVEKEIDLNTPIDYRQLYAQLKAELMAGRRYWFTKEEEARIQQHNKPYYRTSPIEDVLQSSFEFTEPNAEGARLLTAADIYRTLQSRNPAALRGTTCYALSRLLPAIGKRVHTKLLNGYWVREV